MSFCVNRLTKELTKLQAEPVEGFTLTDFSNLMLWQGILDGPKDTPYETGHFRIQFRFEEEYPISAPSLKFHDVPYHPNIYKDGKICVDILQSSEWSPAQNVRTIIHSLRSLLMDPNPTSPANREAAELYMTDKNAYIKKVKEYIK